MNLIEKYLIEKSYKKGDEVEHPKFGRGKVIGIDKATYSIPMLIVKFGKDKIARPENEFI
jgi:hypothetical protein